MAIQTLDRIFKPSRIALIGVTPNPKSVGRIILSNLLGGASKGVVYPVNPSIEAVMGVHCYPDLRGLPRMPDLAVICLPASQVPRAVRECGEAGILGIVIVSAGFREAGMEGAGLEEEVRSIMRQFNGMRILGPNCLGFIAPGLQLNASFASATPKNGNIAFISQSGALCSAVLDWAVEEKIGFSYFVSVGNMIDVDLGDLIDYFGEDEGTKSILLYIESVTHARKFMTAARAFARSKPIIAYKAGRFPESAAVAASHTGAMAAEDSVYDAAFQRIGMTRVFDIGEIFDVTELLGRRKMPTGQKLGIVTNAGGPGVMASDALIAAGGSLARLADDTTARLNASLPAIWSHRNPVDVLGDARSKLVSKAVQIVLEDESVDALLVIITPQAMTNPTAVAKEICVLGEQAKKPILAAWLGGTSMREGIRILNEAGIPTYSTPEQAVRAFMTLVSYSRNLETLYETPKEISVEFPVDRVSIRGRFSSDLGRGGVLAEDTSKALLDAYGISVTAPLRAKTSGEAEAAAASLGFPVAIKILSPDITHKSDVGGVTLDLEDKAMVRSAFDHMMDSIRSKRPEARIEGVTVQQMIQRRNAVEMILGIKKDPAFGTVVMAGLGGTSAEIFADKALGFPPLNERLARRMLESLRIWPLLKGYRGRPPADVDKLVEVLIRLSYMAADLPEILELDINPLLVTGDEAVALDARIVIDPDFKKNAKPYSHLALRPYPEEYVRRCVFEDGSEAVLRPIKPEDVPLWMNMLAGCSKETIYSRFRYFFFWQSHDVASRFCSIDYDREMAIVAEVGTGGDRKLIGVGRLIADPDHETAEYAVLVADPWQDRGVGGTLTDYCIEIARDWEIKKVVALTSTDNPRMIAVFRKRGFEVRIDPDGRIVEVSKDL